jgi:hypothetical protein
LIEILRFELPEIYSEGLLFSLANTRKEFDFFGEKEGVKRKKWFIFYEPNFIYKKRILEKALKNKERNK